MILNTGQRTDIPAFYSAWFMNRVREGFVLVRNPFHPQAVTRYEIRPDLVDLIGFCSKNPEPMLPHVPVLDSMGFGQFWYVTITPYGRDIEPGVPDKHRMLDVFRQLSALVGKDRIGWRYDPILLNETYTADYHRRAFAAMADALEGAAETCVISFIQLYPKLSRTFPEARPLTQEEKICLGKDLIHIAADHGMSIRTCGMGGLLVPYGASSSACMTADLYQTAAGTPLRFPHYKPSRSECSCYLSCDIGAYASCAHFCRYCYANGDPRNIRGNMRRHDPASPFLIGASLPGDVIHQAEQKSWKHPAGPQQAELF